jgi:hypothetical protein
MTTNVYDSLKEIFASDSRWSASHEDYFFYVDDTGFDKIVFDEYCGILFAGELSNIEEWKCWFNEGRNGVRPAADGLSICVVDMATGEICIDSHSITTDGARFAGTGAEHAAICWELNKDAMKAVDTAKSFDACTGGKTVFLYRANKQNNIINDASETDVYTALKDRGMMMILKNGNNMIPIKEALNNPKIKEAFKNISTGFASLRAPFYGIDKKWSEEDKKKLDKVLNKFPPIPK